MLIRVAAIAFAASLSFVGCGAEAQTPPAAGGVITASPAASDISDAAYLNEVAVLRQAFSSEVPNGVQVPSEDEEWIDAAKASLMGKGYTVSRRQLIIAVDRNAKVQQLRILAASPDGNWYVVGGSKVSTGKPGRREHFKTPVGVFTNSTDILGYRALGTYNQNHIRGVGIKGMRVYDFGWQTTEDWRTPGATTQIRLEMHATDPTTLEPRMGRPDSEGCVRVPSTVNRFIDRHGVIDAQYIAAADAGEHRFQAILSRQLQRTILAGDTLIVFDQPMN
jgi:hypothetical protein